MTRVSYAALPNDEKRTLVNDLIGSHTVRQLAAMFGVGAGTISRWTNKATEEKSRATSRAWKDRNKWLNVRTRGVIEVDPFCECKLPASDPLTDSFFKRTETCVYCCKPERKSK